MKIRWDKADKLSKGTAACSCSLDGGRFPFGVPSSRYTSGEQSPTWRMALLASPQEGTTEDTQRNLKSPARWQSNSWRAPFLLFSVVAVPGLL